MHGMNIQVITTPDGTILWTSEVLPGKPHALSAKRPPPASPPKPVRDLHRWAVAAAW